MRLLLVVLYALLLNVTWFATDISEMDCFTDGCMSDTVQNYDGMPY